MRDIMLIVHFLGVAMGVGTSIGFLFLGLAAKKMEGQERIDFMIKINALGKMGHLGLVFLFLSGGHMIVPYFENIGQNPLLIVKLVLFLALGALVGIISSTAKKAVKGDAEKHIQKIETLGKITLPISITIVILAVLVFH